jgi:hypothetical protein
MAKRRLRGRRRPGRPTRRAGRPAFAGYHEFGEGRLEVEAGFPASGPVEGDGDVRPSELPGGQVAVTLHAGPYDQMEPAYQALASWVSEHGGELAGDAWVVYLSDPPAQPDPATWRTESSCRPTARPEPGPASLEPRPSNDPARAELDNRRADRLPPTYSHALAESAVGACPWPVPTRASVLRYGTR